MPERRVSFETSAEKFLGALMERVLRNEAHLKIISENLARLIAAVEEKDSGVVIKEFQSSHQQAYSELSASVIAGLTQQSAEELLSEISSQVSDENKTKKSQ